LCEKGLTKSKDREKYYSDEEWKRLKMRLRLKQKQVFRLCVMIAGELNKITEVC